MDPEEKDMISPSELAKTIDRPFIEVSKAMELFKLFVFSSRLVTEPCGSQ